ncbi:DNA-binding transcriptional regulator, AcrR family [Jiangella alkaliphila]|uniref:DNA-binding transcriptional regulator, AcrR family n=1 Tax=Jiangella alkaliphila TaxID=419479 RepID=A0A1H2LFG2_9ACTN|nr:TetR/AcrR family transcriptional regulator [Jiangella alkaliphila]SDU79649.1 DNA-binding transcriptional regulator, AcrR family [Jiangella alkaliphila]
MARAPHAAASRSNARERVLDTAYALFSRHGVRGVGVDEVIARAPVAKVTFYRHFRSKSDLVLAVLERREQEWTTGYVEAESERRGSNAEERLLAIFDVFGEWFARDDFEGCTFIRVLLQVDADNVVGQASLHYLENIRAMIRSRAVEAGLRDPDDFARSWHILMKGAILAAADGEPEAARRAQDMARTLIDNFR